MIGASTAVFSRNNISCFSRNISAWLENNERIMMMKSIHIRENTVILVKTMCLQLTNNSFIFNKNFKKLGFIPHIHISSQSSIFYGQLLSWMIHHPLKNFCGITKFGGSGILTQQSLCTSIFFTLDFHCTFEPIFHFLLLEFHFEGKSLSIYTFRDSTHPTKQQIWQILA